MSRLIDDLNEEIDHLKKCKIQNKIPLFDGTLVSTSSRRNENNETINSGYYRFENKQFLTLPQDTGALFTINNEIYYGYIVFSDQYEIDVSIDNCQIINIDRALLEIESWRLLELQRARLSNIIPNDIVKKLEKEHNEPSPEFASFVFGQNNAIKHVAENKITLIWGPPGTGKTYTLANIALKETKAGHRVLILSQSNIAVDSAILQLNKVRSMDSEFSKSRFSILRYGMVRSPELIKHPDLLSRDVAFNSDMKLKSEYERISGQLKTNGLSNDKIKSINNERRRIISEIDRKELFLIEKAKIVATTATKATINKNIYDLTWDTVIFDEISMAYISQVMIAASMAKKKLVLIGDYKQLAPIVQNPNKYSILREDIFSYLNIVNKNVTRKHKWLVILFLQFRMHPEIVEFVNKYIYNGALETAEESIPDTTLISSKGPFENNVFTYVDYTKFQGTCFSTRYGSRFNLFSAALAVKIALKAVKNGQSKIGIVTPYSAQSQIISALLHDIEEEKNYNLPISCATIHQFQGSESDIIIFDSVENLPKKEAGKIIASEDDSAMRLINVAITRARGKFIVIGCHEYLRMHQNEISKEMWSLILHSKKSNYISGDDVWSLLAENDSNDCIRFYDSIESSRNNLNDDLIKCNVKDDTHFIEYFHSPRNMFLHDKRYSFGVFFSFIESLNCYKRIYTTNAGITQIKKECQLPESKIRDCGFSPTDDAIFIDDTRNNKRILWINAIPVKSSSEYGSRVVYSFTGDNIVNQFRKLSQIDEGLRYAKEKTNLEKTNQGEFLLFIKNIEKCDECHSSTDLELKLSRNKKYYIYCNNCKKTVNKYIPYGLLDKYIEKKKIKCPVCKGKIQISKKGNLYCINNYEHKIGFSVNDLIENKINSKG